MALYRHHASGLAPRVGKRYSFQELVLGSSRLSPAMRSVFQLLLFSLAFWPRSITGVIDEPVCKGKEEDPESLDVSLPKFKVERHEILPNLILLDLINKI